jgi:hypothetical protein
MIFNPDWRIILKKKNVSGRFPLKVTMNVLLFRFGLFGTFEADNQGNRQGEFFRRLDDAFGDVVATHNATKDVDKYTLHFRIREKDFECLLDSLGCSTSGV